MLTWRDATGGISLVAEGWGDARAMSTVAEWQSGAILLGWSGRRLFEASFVVEAVEAGGSMRDGVYGNQLFQGIGAPS